jgi:F0F1-type ATP synthase assembly protein I
VSRLASIPTPRYPACRIALWQLLASAVVAGGVGWLAGWDGVLSALLGGGVNVSAGVVFATLVRFGGAQTAAATVRTMIRADAAKITVIVLQLGLVFTNYPDIVAGAFIAAFVITVLVAQAAILIRD